MLLTLTGAAPASTPAGREKRSTPTAHLIRRAVTTSLPSWPVALRRVRGWLDPWTFLGRCWQAWSGAPPPPELQALLDQVFTGRPLHLYLRS